MQLSKANTDARISICAGCRHYAMVVTSNGFVVHAWKISVMQRLMIKVWILKGHVWAPLTECTHTDESSGHRWGQCLVQLNLLCCCGMHWWRFWICKQSANSSNSKSVLKINSISVTEANTAVLWVITSIQTVTDKASYYNGQARFHYVCLPISYCVHSLQEDIHNETLPDHYTNLLCLSRSVYW